MTPELPAYLAEVRAMRAMYYYYLLDLFGRVPRRTLFFRIYERYCAE